MTNDDPFLWLEEVEGEAALAWVREQNARSLAGLEADPRYARFEADALAIVNASDRIPYASFRGDRLANFWQDLAHVRGLWRTTSLASYRSPEPEWRPLLDLDALSAMEGRNWVFHGAHWLEPEYRRCLVSLSDGGKDASEQREFDIASASFVAGGFALPEGKQSAVWVDTDALIVGRDWGPGTLTASGYPFILKRVRRGTPLEAAETLFSGTADDVSVGASVLRAVGGRVDGILISRQVNFFEAERYLLLESGPMRLALPLRSSIRGYVAGQLIVSLEEEWRVPSGAVHPAGALLSLSLAALQAGAGTTAPVPIYTPGQRESVEGVATTRDRLLATIYRNVQGSAVVFRFDGADWHAEPLPLPQHASVHLMSASDQDEQAFVDVSGYLTPSTLYLADAAAGTAQPVKSSPPRFDASRCTVEQFEAASKDGTSVPYFIVRPTELAFDGNAPTLLYGYGGFQVSMTPSYSGVIGKLWLERGGVYVVANIRGGGEFGPEWHKAALKRDRQRSYDDFIAVAEDLSRRRITSPRRLGIMGGSNGGLLMGVMLTQRPDLFRAVVIQVPLLDMLRYHTLLAGASWMAEYGDPDKPEEGEFLRHLSPYHNLRPGLAYPEPFFVTSTKDDRVHPGHARKMAAKMAAMGVPFLYYENIDGGHSAAANLRERARRNALEFTYLTQKLMD